MTPNIFRIYDIRGIVDEEITSTDVSILGFAIGTYMKTKGIKRIVLGRDCRISSNIFRDLLVESLLTSGIEIIDIGICPTPLLYYSVEHYRTNGGIMITASHNPSQYNGFKILVGKSTIYGKEIQKIRHISEKKIFEYGHSKLIHKEIIGPYIDYVSTNIHLQSPIKLAIDAGNGTAGPIVIPLMQRIGIDVLPLNCDMNGTFPNHEPDPTKIENLTNLRQVVINKKLPCGIAYDGDSDRLGVLDEQGSPIWGDMLLNIFARDILSKKPGATVIGEVKCSQTLYDDILKYGGKPIMWKVGHSLIKQKMIETGAILAGEMSGHIFFKHRWFGFDDAIYASLRLAELLSIKPKPLSTWLEDLPSVVNTPEIRLACPENIKFRIIQKLKISLASKFKIIDIDGIRVIMKDGWGLIRASNTQPAIILRFEAKNESRLLEIRELIEKKVLKAKNQIKNKKKKYNI